LAIGALIGFFLIQLRKVSRLQNSLLILLAGVVPTNVIYPPIFGWWIGGKNWTDAAFSVILLYIISCTLCIYYLILDLTHVHHKKEIIVGYDALFSMSKKMKQLWHVTSLIGAYQISGLVYLITNQTYSFSYMGLLFWVRLAVMVLLTYLGILAQTNIDKAFHRTASTVLSPYP
jgi:hypothetical protein